MKHNVAGEAKAACCEFQVEPPRTVLRERLVRLGTFRTTGPLAPAGRHSKRDSSLLPWTVGTAMSRRVWTWCGMQGHYGLLTCGGHPRGAFRTRASTTSSPKGSAFSTEFHSVLAMLGGGHYHPYLTYKETEAKGRSSNMAMPQSWAGLSQSSPR